jgi:hypothetical protein
MGSVSIKQTTLRPSPPFLARKFGVSISIGGRQAPLINIGAARVRCGRRTAAPFWATARPLPGWRKQANRARHLLLRRRANNRISNFIFSGWRYLSSPPTRPSLFMWKKLCAPFYSRWLRLCIIIWLGLIRKQRGFSPERRAAKNGNEVGKKMSALTFCDESSLRGFNFCSLTESVLCESKVFAWIIDD